MNGFLQTVSLPRPILAAVVLVGAIAAAYFNSLHGAFVWDDIPTIVDNPLIERLASVLDRPAAVNTTSGRPLVSLSLALNYALGGLNPVGFHLFNVLVHVAAALALFGFVRRLALLPRWAGRFGPHATGLALGVAAVWALHPLQTEAVAYVIQRAESLMGMCYLLTLWLFLRSVESRRPGLWRMLAVVACALGMTAKEVMVSAPVVVLLFDRTFLAGSFRRALASKRLFYGALFGTWLILFWLVVSLGGNRDGSTGGFSAHAAWVPYWLTQFPAIATYLKLAFFPHPLIFQYGAFWLPNVAAALPAALVVVPLLGLTVVALFRWPAIGFFGFWFFSILAVTSLVPGTVDMIVEYRMYVALAPLWILVAAGLYQWRPRLALFVLGAAALAFAAVTVARNRDYRSPLILWTDNVAKRPGQRPRPLQPLRRAAARARARRRGPGPTRSRREAATRLGHGALQPGVVAGAAARPGGQGDCPLRGGDPHRPRLCPSRTTTSRCSCISAGSLRRPAGIFRRRWSPTPAIAGPGSTWCRRSRNSADRTTPSSAGAALVRAHPDFAGGQAELGILLATRQRPAEAIPHLEAALRLDPAQSAARFYLGTVLVQRGERLPEATALLEEAVRQQPDSAIARFNLGTAYLAAGNRLPDAIAQFTAAVQLDPQFADAHFNLAAALESAGGNRTEAIAHYRAAASAPARSGRDPFPPRAPARSRSADAPGGSRRSREDAGAGSRLPGRAGPARTIGCRGEVKLVL